jgi:hypothetical protein
MSAEQALHRHLAPQIRQLLVADPSGRNQRRHALVSVGQCDEGAVAAMVGTHGLAYEQLFMQTPEADMAHIGPWLVELPLDPSDALLHALARMAATEAVSFLGSAMRPPKLAEHLRRFMSGVLPDGSSVLLRYFDPRIGFDMLTHWTGDVRQRFLAPLAWWAGWDAGFQPRRFQGASSAPASSSGDAAIELDAEWLQAIDAIGEPQLTVALLAEELAETDSQASRELSALHPWLCRQIARDALAFARSAGCDGWEDRMLACRLALLTHPRFHSDPGFTAALLDMRGQSLGDVMAALPTALREKWMHDRSRAIAHLFADMVHRLRSFPLSPGLPANNPGAR